MNKMFLEGHLEVMQSKFAPVYNDSFNASFLDVLKKYIFEFNTDLVKGISG